MRQAVRAIVVKDDSLLVMHRNKFGSEYYTLVGGGVEMGEDLESALYRELSEETGITVADPRLVFMEEAGKIFGTQFVYVCTYVQGQVGLSIDSDEAKINQMGQNIYEPMWLPIADLADVPFVSSELKARLVRGLRDSWPVRAERFVSDRDNV